MLDVLVTVSEHTPAEWVRQALDSACVAAKQAGYPVRVIQTEGVPGHIGQAMMQGFAKTSAPYVAWVDDDDYVLPQAFSCLAPHFAANPEAICAREIQLGARGQMVQVPEQRRHHLTAWRRDVIARSRIGDTTAPPIPLLLSEARDIVDVMEWVYVWRRYRSSGMQLRNAHKAAA